MMKTSGAMSSAFWIGNYIYDFTLFLILNLIYTLGGKVGELIVFEKATYVSWLLFSVLWSHSLVGFCKINE